MVTLRSFNCSHPPNPKTQAAKLRLAAEEGWLSLGRDLGVSTQILRLGGIYGPGRRLFLKLLLELVYCLKKALKLISQKECFLLQCD